MRLMGLMPIYQKPRTSVSNAEYEHFPNLLSILEITHSYQIWCSNITYVPMPHGFLYLVSSWICKAEKILSWGLSSTLETDFCVRALEEAIERYGKLEIFNIDQGRQYTSFTFTNALCEKGIRISKVCKGCVWIKFLSRVFGVPNIHTCLRKRPGSEKRNWKMDRFL